MTMFESSVSNLFESRFLIPFRIEIFGNDPAAGSPTATLLRLLLPLAEKHCLDSGAELVAKNELPSPKLYPTANR